jgi:hypothetical protein
VKNLLLVVLCLLCLASVTYAEQITNLPQDGAKFYLSVVGDANDQTYRTVLGWFDTTPDLKELKNTTHFCPVSTDQPIYSRYEPSTKALPMVRLQDAEGNILAEVAGKDIPSTGARLYQALGVQVELRLPHLRRHHPRQQPQKPEPSKPLQPIIVHVDPPAQPLSDGRDPVFHIQRVAAGLGVVCVLALVVGLIISRAKKS